MRKLLQLCFALVAIFWTVSASAQNTPTIEGFWRVAKMQGQDKPHSSLTVWIGERSLWILAPCCNQVFPFRRDGSRIEINPEFVFSSNIPDGVGASSVNGLRSLLPAIAAVELRDGTLTLLGKANETIAILEPIPPAGIENRWWTVVAYRWGLRLHKLYSRFGAVAFSNGSVLGSLGCYQLMGTYVLAGDQIDVRSGASVNCLGNSWQLPDEVFPHLKGSHRIVLEEDRMTLIDAKGRPDIVLTAVPY